MQSKLGSVFESTMNILMGMIVSYLANILILPLFFEKTLSTKSYISMTIIYAAISFVRTYCIRRVFNKLNISKKIKSDGLQYCTKSNLIIVKDKL
jgi:hypothetical protein